MRILVTADLHLDLWQRTGRDPLAAILPVLPTLDALVIAGDLANDPLRNWPAALSRLGRLIDPGRVWICPGNHDYYRWHVTGDDKLRSLAKAAGMGFAQKTVLHFGNLRLLCCTLWANFDLCGDQKAAMNAARRSMNDYLQITTVDGYFATPDDTLSIYEDHVAWLTAEIEKPFSGRTVIVTHHCPSPSATGPVDRLTPAFASDLDDWILCHRPALWLFGHTHRHLHAQVGQTPVINISLGYLRDIPPGEELADILLRGLIDTDAPDFGLKLAGR